MMRKMLLAAALSVTAMTAHADYQCSVTPRDDVIVSPQTVQVKGENGNLVITPDGNVMYNGKQYSLNAAQREQAKDYQAELRSTLPWIDEGAKSRVEKARIALDKIIVQEMGESSKMRSRLTKLDAQLKEQMNRIIETRSDGLTFHYKAIDQVRAEGQQLVNQAMGGILQDSINEMGAKAVLKSGGNPLQNVLGSLGGLQSSIQTEWKKQEKDFQQFGKDVCSRVVTNLTPDKQHSDVVRTVQPLMKDGAALGYSHGFNIVEVGEQIRKDITVVMVAPKCPGTEVREEYKRGFGVPTLIAVHPENDPKGEGMAIAKAWAAATGGHRAGVLESSFVAEVKSDLMGEQTILCGMLQAGSLLCFDKLVEEGTDPAYAEKLIQFGWETITEALKQGGITLMMDRLSNPAKLRAYALSEQLKEIMAPLFQKHMDDIISGEFSSGMMADWANDDKKLLTWREETGKTAFETAPQYEGKIGEQEYFDKGVLMIAMVKAGVELAFETMVD